MNNKAILGLLWGMGRWTLDGWVGSSELGVEYNSLDAERWTLVDVSLLPIASCLFPLSYCLLPIPSLLLPIPS